MLEAGYPAIKAADPSATVVTGSTSPAGDAADDSDVAPVTWLRGLEARWWNAFTRTQNLYDVMVGNRGGAKSIWGAEAGAPTGTDPVADAQQAQWVRDYCAGAAIDVSRALPSRG